MTLHLFVTFDTGDHTDEVGRALAACVAPTVVEEGCLEYRPFRGLDGRALFLKEEWASEDALAAHLATPHLVRFAETVAAITGRPFSEVATLSKAAIIGE